MGHIEAAGWKNFLKGFPWFEGEGRYPLSAYSEFMPPLRTGVCPYSGKVYPWVLSEEDPLSWTISEIEEEYQLRPGLESIGGQIMEQLVHLGTGLHSVKVAGHNDLNLSGNLFWPDELSAHSGHLGHEQYVSILPLSLSKTKDDKGRVRWTFFGASEQGPEKAFWRSFHDSPGQPLPAAAFLRFMQWTLMEAYKVRAESREQLLGLGFRILPAGGAFPFPYWNTDQLPEWAGEYLIPDSGTFEEVRFLLTFRPFHLLPPAVKERYLSGKLALLPFPGSLIFWGIPDYLRLAKTTFNAIQIPMLRLVKRNESPAGIRVPQAGWAHQPHMQGEKAEILEELLLNTYIRTNRWDRSHRHEDGLLNSTEIDPVLDTLFDATLKSLDLYNKPMARNCQLLHETGELLLDGPRAGRREISQAAVKVLEGGLFRYRFYFPPMQAGEHEIFWHRPLVACLSAKGNQPVIAPPDLVTGYFTGYQSGSPDLANAVELWPRFNRRELYLSVLHNFNPAHEHYLHQTPLNLMALLDTHEALGSRQLEREFARRLIRIPKNETLEEWLGSFPQRSKDPDVAKKVIHAVGTILGRATEPAFIPEGITFRETATRAYEEAFWNQILFLAHGEYINKDNADVVQDKPTLEKTRHAGRDLLRLGDYLIDSYREMISESGMENTAEVGVLPFKWETDFEFSGFGGWMANQDGTEYERNILVMIPGKNRSESVVMADHYDTAYMEDIYDTSTGGTGARISAAGADDNHSATTTLLLAARVFLRLAKEGKLERDIWLLHLTGEEFPSDCMGARNFCQNYVQKTLKMQRMDGSWRDLSGIDVAGLFVMDMIAHNRDNARDIFQISPGRTAASLWLGYQAHLANRVWNALAEEQNKLPDRKECTRGQRTKDGRSIPDKALHLPLEGEVRTWDDPMSSLYNTDGMIFSDTGIPCVLFMENYDIHRTGYHDTHDTMENIDLDYGAAVSAICIETVARFATLKAEELFSYK